MRRKHWALCALLTLLLTLLPGRDAARPAAGPAELPAESRFVALTFDDGPRRDTTARLLDGLRERGASATFFLVGQRIAGSEDLLRRMRDEGHQVGNHSWSHADLKSESDWGLQQEVGRTEEALENLLGEGSYWLRPPYGAVDEADRVLIQTPMIKWSIDPRDWESLDAEKVKAAVLKDARPGQIILLHDIYDSSVDAALSIVDALKAEGYRFVTVEELFRIKGVDVQDGVLYKCPGATHPAAG